MSDVLIFLGIIGLVIAGGLQTRDNERLRVEAATSYSAGLTEGARRQALKPCTWQQLFRQGETK